MAVFEPLSSMLPPDLSDDLAPQQQPPFNAASSKKNPPSPSRPAAGTRDPRFKRTSPRTPVAPALRDASATYPKPSTTAPSLRAKRNSPTTATGGKPPNVMTERKSQGERSTLRTRKGSESDKWDVTPDGGSAGREGRQFAVANVGNNGRIYLRYDLHAHTLHVPGPLIWNDDGFAQGSH